MNLLKEKTFFKQTSQLLNFTLLLLGLSFGVMSCGGGSSAPAPDATPNAFSFTAQTDVQLSVVSVSNVITVSGINEPTAISITSTGEYSVAGGSYTSASGTVSNGQSIRVRLTSSADLNTLTETTLTIGGVTGIFSVTTTLDAMPPLVEIVFPPIFSLSNSDSITVRGTASDDISGVSALMINGIAATTTDDFANWSVVVPLIPGVNTLMVEAMDVEDNVDINAAQVVVDNGIFITKPKGIALDKVNNRVLVTDRELSAIAAVDLDSGARTVFSDATTPDTINSLGRPVGIAIDSDILKNRVFVTDDMPNAIVAVDLTTGSRTILSDSFTPDNVNPFVSLQRLVLDTATNRVLVIDSAALVAVDLESGARTPFSDNSTIAFGRPEGIVLDSDNNRLLVTDRGLLDGIIAVDLTTEVRSIFSDDTTPDTDNPFERPQGIVIDRVNNRDRALVVDRDLDALFAVDLTTGARTILSDATIPNDENTFDLPSGIVLDDENNRVLVSDEGLDAIVAVDLATGARTLLSASRTSTDMSLFQQVEGIALDAANNRVLVVDSGNDSVVSVNLSTGVQSTLSDNSTPNSDNPFGLNIEGIVLDSDKDKNRALVVDRFLDAIVAVDLTDGARTILSNATIPDSVTPFSLPQKIILDAAHNRALVTDNGLDALVAVSLTDGARSIFSDITIPDNVNAFDNIKGITLDADGNRALVLDDDLLAIVSVNLSTGARTIFSDETTPDNNNPFEQLEAIALDEANSRLLVVDSSLGSIVAVDLDTGARTVLTDLKANFSGNGTGITVNSENNTALVIDDILNGVMSVDLVSGQAVILSR